MACSLFGAKALSESVLTYGNKLQQNFKENVKNLFQENSFQNVSWKMSAILFRP